mgnify:CR=1 FL=1
MSTSSTLPARPGPSVLSGPQRQRFRLAVSAIASTAFLVLGGCYGSHYGQPYGYPAGPGAVPQGAPIYQGTPVNPNGAPYLGEPTFDSGAAPGGDGQYYDNAPNNNTGNRLVPNDDQYFGDPGGSSSPGPVGSNPDFGTSNPSTPTGGGGGSEFPFEEDEFGGDDIFEEPIEGSPISFEREVSSVTKLPYAHDVAGHRWVQGMVSYDKQDQSWGIVYSINPDRADPYAGYLTLAEDPRFASLKDGDIVRLDGQVDPRRTDHFGRPSYVVAKITPMSL